MPALPPYLIEPIFEQFEALLPERKTDHPLGCHRPRVPDRVVFEKLVQILVFGCAYEKIADEECSESTLRRRRDEWIELGLVDRGKQGVKRSVAVDAHGVPLGSVTAPANRHDSPLLAPTLDAARSLGLVPEGARVHLDRGYDSEATRLRLQERGLVAEISRKDRPAPLNATNR